MYKLPKIFCPKCKTELVRLGRTNDGGYVIPKLYKILVFSIDCLGIIYPPSLDLPSLTSSVLYFGQNVFGSLYI